MLNSDIAFNNDHYTKLICENEYLSEKSQDFHLQKCFLQNAKFIIDDDYSFDYGLFNLEPLFDCNFCNTPTINIVNCTFKNFLSIQTPYVSMN